MQRENRQLEQILHRYVETFRRLGDNEGVALCLGRLGRLKEWRGLYADAERLYRESIALFPPTSDPRDRADAYQRLGDLYLSVDQSTAAVEPFEMAADIFRQAGSLPGLASTLIGLVDALGPKRPARQRITLLTEALDAFVGMGHITGSVSCLIKMGDTHMEIMQWDGALLCFEHAYKYARLAESNAHMAEAMEHIVSVKEILNQLAEALSISKDISEIYHSLEDRKGEVRNLIKTASLHARLGEFKQAERQALKAIDMCRHSGDWNRESECAAILGQVYHSQNKYREALRYDELAYDHLLVHSGRDMKMLVQLARSLSVLLIQLYPDTRAVKRIQEIQTELRQAGLENDDPEIQSRLTELRQKHR